MKGHKIKHRGLIGEKGTGMTEAGHFYLFHMLYQSSNTSVRKEK